MLLCVTEHVDYKCTLIFIVDSQDGFAALHAACQEGHTQVAELLLQVGASVELETEVRWRVGQDCVGDTEQSQVPPPLYTAWSQSVGGIVYSNIRFVLSICP